MHEDRFTTRDIYDHDVIIVKRMGNTDKICYCSSIRKADFEERGKPSVKGSVNDNKLSCNIVRAKNLVKEYGLCNPWDFFVTLTLDKEKYDRYDLKKFKHDLSQFLNNYNRNGKSVKYLFIPEMHKDGAWHMHGLLYDIPPEDLYTNEHGYLVWKPYAEKFGFINMAPIKDIEKCSSYITKYITKDLSKAIKDLNAHLYYASQGLNKAERLFQGHASLLTEYDWESEDGHYKVKNVDNRTSDFTEFLDIYDD